MKISFNRKMTSGLGISALLMMSQLAGAQDTMESTTNSTTGTAASGSTTTGTVIKRSTTTTTTANGTTQTSEDLVGVGGVTPLPDGTASSTTMVESQASRSGSMQGGSMGMGMTSRTSSGMRSSSSMETRRVYRNVRTYRTVPVYQSGRVVSSRRVYSTRRMYRTVPVRSGYMARKSTARRSYARTGE